MMIYCCTIAGGQFFLLFFVDVINFVSLSVTHIDCYVCAGIMRKQDLNTRTQKINQKQELPGRSWGTDKGQVWSRCREQGVSVP